MDDRILYLAAAVMVLSALGLLLKAPGEFYISIGGAYAFLSTAVAIAERKRDQ